ENVCLVLNDEGKVIPLQPNRGLSEIDDVVYGTFFLCGEHGKQMIASGMSQMISSSRNRARYRSTCSLVRLQK
ncbi:DUF3846 domain-containing protein, partial [Gemmiger formicilis]|uniref:DUF3846 domain-containing protein n=1 Tax=Gemmiger formicilis TaxID=745368 RepID=UPI00195DFC11|nr:DUF3846 domain-containing protein [Gemmiger formicilis]